MKRLIKTLLYFLSPLLLILVIFWFWMSIISFQVKNNSQQFQLNTDTSILFAGDSHVVGAIPDTLYLNSKNIGLRSESYYHTFHKLKYFIENQKIRKIYLGFSYHNISSYYDSFINGYYSTFLSSKFFFILPIKEKLRVLLWNRKKLIRFINEITNMCKLLQSNKHNSKSNFIDGFDIFHWNTTFSEKACVQRINKQFFKNGQISEFADLNLIYLNAIIDMCRQKDVELILITTPLHVKYIQRIPKPYVEKFQNFTRGNKSINLASFALVDSCFSPDGDHINYKGVFKINEKLKSKL